MGKRKDIFTLLVVLTCFAFFQLRDTHSVFQQSINGDGKGYYAYLPAIFIYHDLDYGFTGQIEQKYYPPDGSHRKDFRNRQQNGRYVNKYFPGISLFYLPGFLAAHGFSLVSGFPADGYSYPYQLAVGLSHLLFYFLGLWLLLKALYGQRNTIGSLAGIVLLTVGTNVWFLLVYDHSVSHIFLFFLSCAFIHCFSRMAEQPVRSAGRLIIVLALICICRPTSVMVLLFVPFLSQFFSVRWKDVWISVSGSFRKLLLPAACSGLILFVPLLLWKLQSGLYLVYSYNEEGFDFLHPHFARYLFSAEKGWLFWSPLCAVLLLSGFWVLVQKSWKTALSFLLPFAGCTYVFSSWWCWTFGFGFGQRPMIDFYPFLVLPLAIVGMRQLWIVGTSGVLLSALNVVQSYQTFTGILPSTKTDMHLYAERFLLLKRPLPDVTVPEGYVFVREWKLVGDLLRADRSFSEAVSTDTLQPGDVLLMKATVSGENDAPGLQLVISSEDGEEYESIFFSQWLYREFRTMAFTHRVKTRSPFRIYCWNGDNAHSLEIRELTVQWLRHH